MENMEKTRDTYVCNAYAVLLVNNIFENKQVENILALLCLHSKI